VAKATKKLVKPPRPSKNVKTQTGKASSMSRKSKIDLTKDSLLNELRSIGLQPSAGDPTTWEVEAQPGYIVSVHVDDADPRASKIDFGTKISVEHKGVSSFARSENFVVLDCVVRLLAKSYPPESIVLEKVWPAGHGTSGRLDVFIKRGGKSFAMIECKCWGEEYMKEREAMLADGGQLFSYGIQEADTLYLLLFTSTKTSDGRRKVKADQVDYGKLAGANQAEKFAAWDKSFVSGGLMSEAAAAYEGTKKNLKKSDLIELDQPSGQGLFNSFAEILRRHAVSDKSNAFNKIFNLFVCKIYDEDSKKPEEELDFQWKTADSFDQLLCTRLSYLYRKGLKNYLQIEVQEKYFAPLAEFSFIDIYDKSSFDRNGQIIREVVELLQQYQLKYTAKHQFLGEFFEDLLNTGVKQEAGQYFTPSLLARFFVRSLPLRQLVDDRISEKSTNILPTLIDFACGAGHFLTEAIAEVQEKINLINSDDLVGRIQKRFISIRDNFQWAEDYVYGIEKDYRLAKTTKIAMFLYGDGDAVIVNGEGLDDFEDSVTYREKLVSKTRNRDLSVFDAVISNPPFSIPGFSTDVPRADENFALSKYTTPRSRAIECFFIERAGHLLQPDGVMGLILPLSILNNETEIFTEARKLLLIAFNVVGLIELRDKTFKPTGTATVGVFAIRRDPDDIRRAFDRIVLGLRDKRQRTRKLKTLIKDITSRGVKEAELVAQADEWAPKLKSSPPVDGIGLPDQLGFLLALSLNDDRQIVIAYSGEGKQQEAFLGYRFSKSRGQEGIEVLPGPGGEQLLTQLFDPGNVDNTEKVNAHILAAFRGERIAVPESLSRCLTYVPLRQMIKLNQLVIDNPSAHFAGQGIPVQTLSQFGDFIEDYEQESFSLTEVINSGQVTFLKGLTYNKKRDEVPYATKKRVLTADNFNKATGQLDLEKKLFLRDDYEIPKERSPLKGDILICTNSGSLAHLGKVAWVEKNFPNYAVGSFLAIIRCKDVRLGKALYYRLLSEPFRAHMFKFKGQNINNLTLKKINEGIKTLPKDLDAFVAKATKLEKKRKK